MFKGSASRFFIEDLQHAPLTFLKEVFTDNLCVERYAGHRLNCKYWTVESGLLKVTWIAETVIETGL